MTLNLSIKDLKKNIFTADFIKEKKKYFNELLNPIFIIPKISCEFLITKTVSK